MIVVIIIRGGNNDIRASYITLLSFYSDCANSTHFTM